MNSKTTGIWLVIAAALFAFLFVVEHWFHPAATGPAPLMPQLRPADVTSVQVYPAGALAISAARTNGGWVLTSPVAYPAQAAAVQALVEAVQKLAPAKISAAELREHKNPDAEFGLENPRALVVINADDQSWQLKVGNKTAPGDQVYLRVAGTDGVFVADAGWLNLLPRTADEWRDTALVPAGTANADWILLTNNAKGIVIELRRDPTNHLWRMLRPLQARADADRIATALQQLESASVTRFVADNPPDLTGFGLQPADLDLWLGRGTNPPVAVHVGGSPTNDATQVYARREGWNTVFTTAADTLTPWRGMVNNFRDSRLFELTAPVAEIEARGDSQFILRQRGSNNWEVVGEKFPAEAANVQEFIKTLVGLRIADFVKDFTTRPDLETNGFIPPRREIILRSKAGDTNSVIADLLFGATQTNEVFARIAGEDFIYAIKLQDFNRLPEADWEFRDLDIWNFKVDDVAQITIHQDGRTRQILHAGPDKWSLAAGSQGMIEGKYIEQAVEQLHEMRAVVWVARNFAVPEQYGFGTNNLQLTFELKNGEKNTVDFGASFPQKQTALAAVTLDGERWAFLFSPKLYQFVLSYLTIPANVP